MADTSLKALTSVVFQMAEDTRKDIKPDVKDIKNTLVGTEGILNTLYTISDSITNLNKKNDITRLTENKNKNQNRLLKNTNSITSLLGKI
jgi:DNA-binding transcriptional regulator GbsR (MarR family)